MPTETAGWAREGNDERLDIHRISNPQYVFFYTLPSQMIIYN